ncbi:MAG: histidinol-phosphate transaminase [Polyangiales bacterium]
MSDVTRVHGGVSTPELQQLGLARDALLDLSVNVSPAGPHPAVVQAVRAASLSEYPQPWAAEARAALAASCGVESAHVVVGHGSTELIWSAVALLRAADGPLLVAGPTFSEPALAAHAHGVPVVELRARAETGFSQDLEQLARAIEQHHAAGVYLCQPNNPDGQVLPASLVRELCSAYPDRLFLLDQAFLALSTRHADAALHFPAHVLVVRSLTKEHALPGLRVGYALGDPALLARLNALRPSWMVSNLAEAAIIAACQHPEHVAAVRDRWLEERVLLAEGCRALGLHVLPSETPYFLARVPLTDGADGLRARLLARHGIAVRSCSSFGLPDYIRLAGCGPVQRARVLAALAQELAG